MGCSSTKHVQNEKSTSPFSNNILSISSLQFLSTLKTNVTNGLSEQVVRIRQGSHEIHSTTTLSTQKSPAVQVIRDGKAYMTSYEDLVTGDLITVKPGVLNRTILVIEGSGFAWIDDGTKEGIDLPFKSIKGTPNESLQKNHVIPAGAHVVIGSCKGIVIELPCSEDLLGHPSKSKKNGDGSTDDKCEISSSESLDSGIGLDIWN